MVSTSIWDVEVPEGTKFLVLGDISFAEKTHGCVVCRINTLYERRLYAADGDTATVLSTFALCPGDCLVQILPELHVLAHEKGLSLREVYFYNSEKANLKYP